TTLTNRSPARSSRFLGIDANDYADIAAKALALKSGHFLELLQAAQVANPDHTIVLSQSTDLPRLSDYATSWQGLVTGDTSRFVLYFWELPEIGRQWEFYISSPSQTA